MAFSGKRGSMESENNVVGDRFDVLEKFPAKVHVVMQYIKEIANQHTYEDIYAMLEECNMDPDEATNKLLSVDTFHQVKPKHSKRRSNASTRGWHAARSMQQRRAGGGRGNNSSAYNFNDAGHRRQVNVKLRNSDVSVAVQHRAQNPATPHTKLRSVSNGSSSREPSEGASVADVRPVSKRPALLNVAVKRLLSSNPGPTPAPTPTTASLLSSSARFDGRNLESQSIDLPISANPSPVLGVYSSASDPVLLPSLTLHNPGAVGAIKRETGSSTEFSETFPENRLSTGQHGRSNSQEGAVIVNETSQGVEKSNISEPSRNSCSLNLDKSSTAISKQRDVSIQKVNGPSKEMEAQIGTETQGANMQSLSKLSDSVLEQATSQLDNKLEKLKISKHQHQPVIFPDHIQVPEALKNELTFGSLNDISGPSRNENKESSHMDGTVLIDPHSALEPSLCHQTAASPLEMNALSAAVPKSGQLKPELLPQIGGSQYPLLPTTPEYSFGLVPPILGPSLVPVEATEMGNSPVPSASSSSQPVTQPMGAGQNSLAVSPQLLPFLRQPFPSNYVPYNPYFPQLYMPHGSHQFLGHSGFPPQASTGNIYMPPAAATGVKYPISSVYKPGTIAGNLAHFGIPSGYGSYGSSAIGYGLGANMTPSSSASNEDLATPEPKEKNLYSTMKQNDEQHMWTSAPTRDMSTLPGNFFYNIPQGQHVAFSPAHSSPSPIAGMYHLPQTTGPPTSVPQQSQAIAGSAESGIPPSGSYQQSHPQIHWNTKLLNRENI